MRRALTLSALVLAGILVSAQVQAQEERTSRIPVLGKIVGGSSRRAFSGKVQSLDLKRKLLNVDTVEGGATELFPVKKSVSVSTASGEKLKLTQLTPGTNIIVYYEQKEGRRLVKEIVVLAVGPAEEKKPSPPPS